VAGFVAAGSGGDTVWPAANTPNASTASKQAIRFIRGSQGLDARSRITGFPPCSIFEEILARGFDLIEGPRTTA
jgi:hypothetical protein